MAAAVGGMSPHSVMKAVMKRAGVTSKAGLRTWTPGVATRLCRELLEAGVPGLHFYALNRSRSAEAILRNLDLAQA